MVSLLRRTRLVGTQTILYLFLIATAGFMVLPFVWMLSTSLKPQNEIFGSPPILVSSNMSLDGYAYVIKYGAFRALLNTSIVAGVYTFFALFFCTLGGYAFSKYRFPGRNALFAFLLGTMVIPGAVTMVPTYVLMVKFKWINSFLPLIVPGVANAFGIFFMRQYIGTVNDELLDAARIDGCSEFGVFWRVILPICAPGMISLGLIFFMRSWNDFLGPLIYLKSPSLFTLPLMIMQLQGPPGYSAYREWMAVSMISTLPLLLLFLIFQRRFSEGITAGATKG